MSKYILQWNHGQSQCGFDTPEDVAAFLRDDLPNIEQRGHHGSVSQPGSLAQADDATNDRDERQDKMTRPWPEIQLFYNGLPATVPAFKVMQDLVKQIITSRYVTGLHAWTSMHTLCISQNEEVYPNVGPHLTITPTIAGDLEFFYVDTFIVNKQWHRTVSGEEGFDRLERFFEQLNWFPFSKEAK